MRSIASHAVMRLALALVLVGGCGRVNFDPLSDGGGSGSGTNTDGGSGSIDGGGGSRVCMGGTPSCNSTAGSLSLAGTYQAGNTTRTSGNGMAGTCGGATGNEFTVQLIALQAGTYQFSTAGSQFDTVLYIRDSCTGTELLCADTPGGTEVVVLPMTQSQSIIVAIDGADECGVFQFTAQRAPS